MCAEFFVDVHMFVRVCVCVCNYLSMCICVCVCMCVCMCNSLSMCIYVFVCACVCVCMCVCVRACVCVTPVLQESSIWRMCVATGPTDEGRGPHMSDSIGLAQDKEACVERGDTTVDLYRY